MKSILINFSMAIIISLSFIIFASEISELSSFIRGSLFETIMVLGLTLLIILIGIVINRTRPN